MLLRMTESSIVSELGRMGYFSNEIKEIKRNSQNEIIKVNGISKEATLAIESCADEIGLKCILTCIGIEERQEWELLLVGSPFHYDELLDRLKMQDSIEICNFIGEIQKILEKSPVITTLADQRVLTYDHLMVMGIVNVTNDSFYGASCKQNEVEVLSTVEEMIAGGAEIIDLGAESTRPGAIPLNAELECERLIPVIEEIRKRYPQVILSIDTYRAETAKKVIAAGAHMINDVSGGADPQMAQVVAQGNVPIILMHLEANPQEMKPVMPLEDIEQVWEFLKERRDRFLEAGVRADRIILDPGIGFGKSLELNLGLMNRLEELKSLGHPILLGVSRKGTIGKVLGGVPTEERLYGTIGVSCQAVVGGAHIVRVHDVKENAQAIRMLEAVRMCR